MEKTAKFEKVSLQRFQQDLEKVCPWFDEAQSLRMYESIQLPVRATKGSAGYDFFLPFDAAAASFASGEAPHPRRDPLSDDAGMGADAVSAQLAGYTLRSRT